MEYLPIAIEIFTAIIEAIQLSSLSFVSQLSWSSIHVLEDIAKIRLDFSGPDFIDCFIAVIAFSLGYFLYGLMMPLIGEGLGEINVYIWFLFGKQILFGVLFTPLITLIIQIFYCDGDGNLIKDKDFKCWTDEHNALVFLAVLTICLFLPAAIYKSLAQDLEARDQSKMTSYKPNQRHIDGKYLIIRLAVVTIAAGYSSPDSSTRLVCAVIILFLTMVPPIFMFLSQPHKFWLLNVMKSSLYSATAWSALSACTVASSESSSSSSLILLGCPIIFIIMIAASSIFINKFGVSDAGQSSWLEMENIYKIAMLKSSSFASCLHRFNMRQKSRAQPTITSDVDPNDKRDNAMMITVLGESGVNQLMSRLPANVIDTITEIRIQFKPVNASDSLSIDSISSDLSNLLSSKLTHVKHLSLVGISYSKNLPFILSPRTSVTCLDFYDAQLTDNQAMILCEDICQTCQGVVYVNIGKCNANVAAQAGRMCEANGSPLIEVN